jgi:hypothetical protein
LTLDDIKKIVNESKFTIKNEGFSTYFSKAKKKLENKDFKINTINDERAMSENTPIPKMKQHNMV